MRAVVALLLACIVLGSEAEEALRFPKYRDACPGYVSETNKEFRQFIDGVLSGNETSLMTVCKSTSRLFPTLAARSTRSVS